MTKPTVLTEEEFHKLARNGKAPAESQLRKAFIVDTKAATDGSRNIDFILSTSSVDRAGDTINQAGWRLDNFKRNPVVLWSHQSDLLPVAKASNIRVEGGKLKATAEFMTADISGFADAVYKAYKGGFLSAVSVGFAPLKYSFASDPNRDGVDFIEQELLEFSCCPVPCLPDALVEMRSAGIDMARYREWNATVSKTPRLDAARLTLLRLKYDMPRLG